MSPNPLRTYLCEHDLMRFAGLPAVHHCHQLKPEQTRCIACGHELSEVVVTRS